MSVALRLYLSTRRSDGAADIPSFVPRPDGHVMWFHVASEGDVFATLELIRCLREDSFGVSYVVTSPAVVELGQDWDDVFTHMGMDDDGAVVDAFLDHWRPSHLVWVGEPLDPAYLMAATRSGVDATLINGHIDRKQRARWRLVPGAITSMVGAFSHILTTDAAKARDFVRFGADDTKVDVVGALQEGTTALPYSEVDRAHLAEGFAGRPVWLAAQIEEGEEKAVIEAHVRATRRAHRLMLIIVTADASRGVGLANDLSARGLRVILRSSGLDPRDDTQIYIADGDGAMGLWYRLASVSFLGQSLVENGGINPFDAAALGSGIIHGPHVGPFARSYGRLAEGGASKVVRNVNDLARAVEVLQAPDVAATLAHEAWKICTSGAEVTDRIKDLLLDKIDMFEEVP